MSDRVVPFRSKIDIEIESNLKLLDQICALKKRERESKKCLWVMETREGYYRVINGNDDPPRTYALPNRLRINLMSSRAVGDYCPRNYKAFVYIEKRDGYHYFVEESHENPK